MATTSTRRIKELSTKFSEEQKSGINKEKSLVEISQGTINKIRRMNNQRRNFAGRNSPKRNFMLKNSLRGIKLFINCPRRNFRRTNLQRTNFPIEKISPFSKKEFCKYQDTASKRNFQAEFPLGVYAAATYHVRTFVRVLIDQPSCDSSSYPANIAYVHMVSI